MKDNGIIAVFLAAGMSRRMTVNKLALPLGTTTIGNLALENAINSNLAHIIVVTRKEDSLNWIDAALWQPEKSHRWTSVSCLDAINGQAHSLRCGMHAAKEWEPRGVMVLLADQPFLSVKLINELIVQYGLHSKGENSIPFLAACYQGVPRPPIIFSPALFPELLKLKGDEGARRLLQKQKGVLLNYETGVDFLDIDTRDDYEKLMQGGIHFD